MKLQQSSRKKEKKSRHFQNLLLKVIVMISEFQKSTFDYEIKSPPSMADLQIDELMLRFSCQLAVLSCYFIPIINSASNSTNTNH